MVKGLLLLSQTLQESTHIRIHGHLVSAKGCWWTGADGLSSLTLFFWEATTLRAQKV